MFKSQKTLLSSVSIGQIEYQIVFSNQYSLDSPRDNHPIVDDLYYFPIDQFNQIFTSIRSFSETGINDIWLTLQV